MNRKSELFVDEFKANQMEEEEGDDEEMGVAETYADYWPAKRELIFKFKAQ